MCEPHKYQPLSSLRATRVLELLPALNLGSELHCSLLETSLDDPEPFDALSYVWGDPAGDRPLQCQSHTILITENCELALRYLRHQERKVLLWVDAVCIDQKSVLERNHQVSVMGDIYRKARKVIIWLGEGNENLREVFQRYNALERVYIFRKAALDFVLSNKWLTRIWTAQELLLASDAIVRCGSMTMTWLSFYALVVHSCYQHGQFDGLFQFRIRVDGRQYLQHAMNNLSHRESLLETDYPHRRWSNVQDIIRSNQCTDLRDKVYGIYSLLPFPSEALPRVDYSKSTTEIYEEFTKAIILCGHSLDFLLDWQGRKTLPGLPSWVPDFSIIASRVMPRTGRMPLTATCGSSIDAKALVESKSGQLALKCHFLATVIKITRKWPQQQVLNDTIIHIADWLHLSSSLGSSSTVDLTVATLQDLLTLGDMEYLDSEWSHFKQELHNDLTRAVSSREWDKARTTAIRRIHHTVSTFIAGHTLFTTNSNHIGVCMGEVKQDDVVVLVAGCSSPLVCRAQGDNFSFIGHAYVRGIMKGEAWPTDVATEQLNTIILI